ncbi:amino acid adenylation domain-containing protein, partial [Nonomuraea diastatica]|uniref:amino acid adenylation domain-containing protein n=1 Tax=Nonomuraea diastatica TaxID=1848329 RepID=UPI00319E0940
MTASRFVADPFAGGGERMYRTGDVARWSASGDLEFVGRNDDQVQVRGYRVELGEIEAALLRVPGVSQAAVNKDLVAYYVGEGVDAAGLREHLTAELPGYMVPAAFVALEVMPLTPSGKVDRAALPAPDGDAFARAGYQEPEGPVERVIAEVWAALLSIDRVGRYDDFFALGGHSLLAVTLVERLREHGIACDVRTVFAHPTVAGLAAADESGLLTVPDNLITKDTAVITPELLPLVELSQEQIDRIVANIPGGTANVQDIYPLAPLQEGMLFHHLMSLDSDAYVLSNLLAIDTRERLDEFLEALQTVIDRHDVLRTSLVWEGVSRPVQVVHRHARLTVEQVDAAELAGVDKRIDLGTAPLVRVLTAHDAANDRWLLLVLMHHVIDDNTSLQTIVGEVGAIMAGRADELPAPVPYRNVVAQAVLGISEAEHEEFFTGMLAGIGEPTAPYGILDVHGDGTDVTEASMTLDAGTDHAVRDLARRSGVSAAAVFHLAWALVVARLSGRDDVVFGTVLFGRMQGDAGSRRGVGASINTLPVRLDVTDLTVGTGVREAHRLLTGLIRHEHAPLSLAQRCSGLPSGTPLFTSLLNYRHNTLDRGDETVAWPGVEALSSQERTNYPLVASIDDGGDEFKVTAQTRAPIDPASVCALLGRALTELATADRPLAELDVLSEAERREVVAYGHPSPVVPVVPVGLSVPEVFAAQVRRSPGAVAVGEWTYAELDVMANRVANRLRELGVIRGARVVVRAPRSAELVAVFLGILKAGGVYVPVDMGYPEARVARIVADSVPVVVLDGLADVLNGVDTTDPGLPVSASDAAYVMYTSGSTGAPKGVVVSHANIVSLVVDNGFLTLTGDDVVAFAANPAFDASTWEIWGPLLNGARIAVIGESQVLDAGEFGALLKAASVSVLFLTTRLFDRYVAAIPDVLAGLRCVMTGGERAEPASFARLLAEGGRVRLLHCYGPTETTTFAVMHDIGQAPTGGVPIGRPVAGRFVRLLDGRGRPVPVGVVGELYLGGLGTAHGYLDRAELTAARFVPDPLEVGGRLYRTGDLSRWLPGGTLEFLGRNDFQVKIRGFRVEPGEVEAALLRVPGVSQAVVSRDLVAYYVGDGVGAAGLRERLTADLPGYMVPAAFVALETLPLTPNGKVDRKALPAPDGDAYARMGYQEPEGEIEQAIAGVWAELLGVERVGRFDDFFALGGHSLLAVSLVERLRERGITCDVRSLFAAPTVAGLAESVSSAPVEAVVVPANLITEDTTVITPELLPLVDLSQEQIDRIVAQIPGGTANVQDIYPLAPLQEGMLFHHLMSPEHDVYVLSNLLAIDTRENLDGFLAALQTVIDRHDVLRT